MQKELDKITNAAAQLALQFNIDLSSGSVEERQSTRGLGKQYFKDAVLENEYIYKLGKEHKFTQTIDIKDSEFSLSKDQFTNWLEKNDRDYKVISNNKIEVYKTFNQAFKDGTADALLEGHKSDFHENLYYYKQGYDFGLYLYGQQDPNENK